jgi:diguanylate cyclase (GGDEF)-like protein
MRIVRLFGPAFLTLHLILRFTNQSIWTEVLLYNVIGIFAIISTVSSPTTTFLFAKIAIAFGISAWTLGSTIASFAYYNFTTTLLTSFGELMYIVFYPFIMIGSIRILRGQTKYKKSEVLDGAIIGFGITTFGAAFLLPQVLPGFNRGFIQSFQQLFYPLAYPLADLSLMAIAIALLCIRSLSVRTLLLVVGITIFVLTDFLYLSLDSGSNYSIGSMVDDGWLLGLLLISESFWHLDSPLEKLHTAAADSRNPIVITLSVFLSATLLALISLQPNYLPRYVALPAVATLVLAFSRLATAINQSRHIGVERILARTDELTGLPNRRHLISEIEEFINKEGSLLLLDLDGFKPINDTYGHEIGDKVLKQVALRFDRALPHDAFLARLGGDEFGVLIEGLHENAIEIALALRATLSYPIHIDSKEILLGVSIGFAKNNGGTDLLLCADTAMYKAKREGLGVCPL